MVHTVKGYSVVNEAQVDAFLDFPCFLHDPINVGNLISGSSAFSKSSLYIWKFTVHILLKPSLKDLGHNLSNIWSERNYTVVWTFFGIALHWDWNENWPFLVLWPLLSFPNLLAYWVQHFNSILIFRLPKFILQPGIMVSLKFHSLRKIMVWKKLSCQARNLDSPLWQRHAKLRGQIYKDEKV